MKFIIGYFIGVILIYSIFFGLKMISLYENDIKRFFTERRKARNKE